MPPANGNPKLALGVKKTFGEWKMGSYFSFFQECFNVSFLWANVHGNSLGLVIWPAYWEVPEIRVKIKVTCLLPQPSGVQLTNGERGTEFFQTWINHVSQPAAWCQLAVIQCCLRDQLRHPMGTPDLKGEGARKCSEAASLLSSSHPTVLEWGHTYPIPRAARRSCHQCEMAERAFSSCAKLN